MLAGLRHLALEAKDLDAARGFYVGRLGLTPRRETARELAFRVGETDLLVRRPDGVPRGGLHTHYAFSTTASGYEAWRRRLADFDPVEFDFGDSRSLYVYDPDGNCVEVGGVDGEGGQAGVAFDDGAASTEREGTTPPLTGIFEVVLEVADLDAAEAAYRALGFEAVDRGSERRRVRLRGPVDLELWEPQLGIADARGGVHVDIGFETDDPEAAAAAFAPWTAERVATEGGVRVRDADGHWVTFGRSER
ncbi:MAG: VOC family protein [Haloplanus sp.]